MKLIRVIMAAAGATVSPPLILLALAQPLPLPLPVPTGPGGSCAHGWSRSGSFCVPRAGAQDAIPLPANGTCPFGWTRSGSFCLRSG
jgi:hypothetical protein